jgi:uncharacterized delta-60 repeat protein
MNSRTRPSVPAVQETARIKNSISQILRRARESAPTATAALASGLLCPLALGAPGDLDPSFGEVGRTGLMVDFAGPAWSVEPQGDDQLIFAGGDDSPCYDYYYWGFHDCDRVVEPGFLGRLSSTGSIDLVFTAARLEDTVVLDTAVQPDGKVVGVGEEFTEGPTATLRKLVVFRLEREGVLDPTFGEDGFAHLPSDQAGSGHSLVLDPDGRIVVAGTRGNKLTVLRLLANGAVDASFGNAGVFSGRANDIGGAHSRILRTAAGGYRITTNLNIFNGEWVATCRVLALTAKGTVDESFGALGYADVGDPSVASVSCSSMAAQADGRLLVAGRDDQKGLVIRLLSNGERDASFSTAAVAGALEEATALAVDGDGAIVAGRGPAGVPGALVVRLQADGMLDSVFGDAGTTWIDLPSDDGVTPLVHDLATHPDGDVLLAGQAPDAAGSSRAFVARLLGDGGGDGPGVLGVMHPRVVGKEQGQQAVVVVRRMGGASGRVSVGYRTQPRGGGAFGESDATAGQDYTRLEDRLEWDDGDASERQIVVPIANDSAPEGYEQFVVALTDAQGGAGLGTRNATVEIPADGDPAGQFAIEMSRPGRESVSTAEVVVHRNYYSSGAVSVTVMPVPGTAIPGEDYTAGPVTVSWADGETEPKSVLIPVLDDDDHEPVERFAVELSAPTGGAIVGARSTTSISIVDDDPKPSSGGGRVGLLSLLLLSAAGLLRRAAMTARLRSP